MEGMPATFGGRESLHDCLANSPPTPSHHRRHILCHPIDLGLGHLTWLLHEVQTDMTECQLQAWALKALCISAWPPGTFDLHLEKNTH